MTLYVDSYRKCVNGQRCCCAASCLLFISGVKSFQQNYLHAGELVVGYLSL